MNGGECRDSGRTYHSKTPAITLVLKNKLFWSSSRNNPRNIEIVTYSILMRLNEPGIFSIIVQNLHGALFQ